MNRYQPAEYERCRNNGCCQNDCDGQSEASVQSNAAGQYDSCAEAAVSNASAANNGNGNGCGCGCAAAQAAAVEDLPTYACMCAVIAKVNELLAVLRAAGVIEDCE